MELSDAYKALQGQIVEKDVYHMRDVEDIVSCNDPLEVHEAGHKRPFNFTPHYIFDLGAHSGFFSKYCRELFPSALIIAVEPDPKNCIDFAALNGKDSNIILYPNAIGSGEVWHSIGAANGSGENYITSGVAYPEKEMIKEESMGERYELSSVDPVSLSHLISRHVVGGYRFIVKMDIEGNEQFIFTNEYEMLALAQADYITGEIHNFSINAKTNILIKEKIQEALERLEKTHKVERDGLNFYATKL